MKQPPDKRVEPMLVPRRASRRKRRAGTRARRLVRQICLCGVSVLVLVWAVLVTLRPFLLDRKEVAAIRRLSKDVGAVEAENKGLREQIRILNTPKGVEVEARRQGWVRPGEVLVQTSDTPPPPPASLPGSVQVKPPLNAVGKESGLFHRAIRSLSRFWARVRSNRPSSAEDRPQ